MRSSSIVSSNLGNTKKILKLVDYLGLNGLSISAEPMPLFDYCGCEITAEIVLHST